MNIIITGMPGAGRGTQAREIAVAYQIPYISTGEIFRSFAEMGSPIGLEVKAFMDMGKLVPDSLVNKLLWDRMGEDDIKEGFVLDGYPRTRQQAEALEAYLESKRLSLDAVLYLAVGKEALRKRLEKRSDSSGSEGKSEVIERRLQARGAEMEMLMGFYQEAGIISIVNGEQEPDIVFEKIQEVLQFHFGERP